MVGNLKMRWKSPEEAQLYAEGLRSVWRESGRDELRRLVICPPGVFLERIGGFLPSGIALGAQDVFWEDEGSYTGETSPLMLRSVGVSYAIIGHSERRTWLGETDSMINRKVRSAIRNGIRPILCVGETREEHLAQETIIRVSEQIEEGLQGMDPVSATQIIVAYEPRWAIGSDETPMPDEIRSVSQSIRTLLERKFGPASEDVSVLYGGSVNTDNFRSLCIDTGMDGALVGRESLDPEDMFTMYEQLA